MCILVHHKSYQDSHKAFIKVYEMLREVFPKETKMRPGRTILKVYGVTIDFRGGHIEQCAGIRPDYYFADTEDARCFLAQSAAKCGGKELRNLSKILGIILEHISEGGVAK